MSGRSKQEPPCWHETPEGIAWAAQMMAEQRKQFARDEADSKAMRKALAGTKPCGYCNGTGIDGEECSDGYHGGGRCLDCDGSGRVNISKVNRGTA